MALWRSSVVVAVAAVAAWLLAGCGEDPQPPAEEPTVSEGSAAASLDEVAARLADRIKPTPGENVFPGRPCGTADGSVPWPTTLPRYQTYVDDNSDLDGWLRVTVWAFPSETEAEELASAYTNRMSDCAMSIDEPKDDLGASHIAELVHTQQVLAGWQGMRTADAGYYSNDSAIAGWYANHSAYAQRGVLFVAVEFRHQSGDGDPDHRPPAKWQDQAEAAVTDVLKILGEPSAVVSDAVPDENALSHRITEHGAPLSTYHPDAELVSSFDPWYAVTGNAPDLFCNLLDDDERGLPLNGLPIRIRELTADLDPPTSDDPHVSSGPPGAVSAVEIVAVATDAEQAERRAGMLRDAMKFEPSEPDDSFGAVVTEPCRAIDGWEQRDGVPVELVQWTEVPYDNDGWAGAIGTVAARMSDTGADAPSHRSAAHAVVIVHNGPLVVYLRYQIGAGNDLQSALDQAKSVIDDALAQLPAGG